MRKVISASVAVLGGVCQARQEHPFVGEAADVGAVHHERGLSQKLQPRKAAYNKFRDFASGDGLFEPQNGFFGHIYESLFKSSSTERRTGRPRLGQMSFASILENTDGLMWTGEIYMGKLTKMDVVYDTGSDWLVVESSECTNCEGNTYDISTSMEAGIAT